MSDLKKTEREVKSRDGIRVGQRVKVRASVIAEWRMRGMSADGIAARSAPGRVKCIVVSTMYEWTSAEIEHESGIVGWQSCDDLEGAS